MKNLILDMGNVIIDFDVRRTVQAFANLAALEVSAVQEKIRDTNLFHLHESGQISEVELRDIFRRELGGTWSDETLDSCWNALLFPLEKARVEWLLNMRKKYNLYLLSNTNSIHFRYIDGLFRDISDLEGGYRAVFKQAFLSYEMKAMKPNLQIYEMVLTQAQLIAEECLFIDDVRANTQAAEALGIPTITLEKPTTLLDLNL